MANIDGNNEGFSIEIIFDIVYAEMLEERNDINSQFLSQENFVSIERQTGTVNNSPSLLAAVKSMGKNKKEVNGKKMRKNPKSTRKFP